MNFNELTTALVGLAQVELVLPNGTPVPEHFHVTEVGKVVKHFVDCGGKVRDQTVVSLQLWVAEDYNHRLHAEKLSGILAHGATLFGLTDEVVEVEYQGETIQKFGLRFDGKRFHLTSLETACLALEECGLPVAVKKPLLNLADTLGVKPSCTPGGGCC